MVSPSAASPAMTSDTEARRSVAITGAPRSVAVPSMVAVSPSSDIRAPNRAAHHALTPPVLDHGFGRLGARPVVAIERTGREIAIELRAAGRELRLKSVK